MFVSDALADVLHGEERGEAFARAVESDPGWAEYERRSGRTLPVVALRPLPGLPRYADGAGSGGAMLTRVHDAFRRELALIRDEVAAAGASVGVQLRMNCLTLCAGLRNHYAGEDGIARVRQACSNAPTPAVPSGGGVGLVATPHPKLSVELPPYPDLLF